MNYIVLAISGKATTGKSTLGDFLQESIKERYPLYKVKYYPFASELKRIAKEYFGWDGSKEIFTDNGVVVQDKGRMLLINIGGYFRKIRPSIWYDFVIDKIKAETKGHAGDFKIYLIDDLRYLNEADALNTFGEKIYKLRINRDSVPKLDIESEVDLDGYTKWDKVVNNNGTLEQLRIQADKLADELIMRSFKH